MPVILGQKATWFGGSDSATISASHNLVWNKRAHAIFANTSVRDVFLPDARKLPTIGGPIYYIFSDGFGIVLKPSGASLDSWSVPADNLAIVCLMDNTFEEGTWLVDVRPIT